MTKKVLVLGELNVDIILNNIVGFPEMGKEILADNMNMVLGSSSAIFAANLSALGVDVSFLGMVGNDRYGSFVLQELEKKHVNTSQVIKNDEVNTGATIVLNYDMDRAMVTYPGAMSKLSKEHLNSELFKGFHHVHISSVFLQPLILRDLVEIVSLIKNTGATISIDPQWDPNEDWSIDLFRVLPHIDYFIPNIKEIQLILGASSLSEIYNRLGSLGKKVIIKNGELGAAYFQNDQVLEREAYLNYKVVDCIGAGDSFNAGFILQFLQERSLADCVDFGNITGAINTTEAGGTAAFRNFKQIMHVAAEKFNYKARK